MTPALIALLLVGGPAGTLGPVEQVRAAPGGAAAGQPDGQWQIEQIPADRTEIGAAPEQQPDNIAPPAPGDAALRYERVHAAWERLRRANIQPTPETMAQAVTPEVLAQFLAETPGAELIFAGHDGLGWTVSPPK